MKTYGYIYKTTNLLNQNIYIGQHKGLFYPEYYGSGDRVKMAIKKYGVQNFKVEFLTYAFNSIELNQLEIKFIADYRRLFPSGNMYNIASGGMVVMAGRHHTKKSNHKNRIAKLGKTLKELGHKLNCSCSFCRTMRGEYRGVPHTKKHNDRIAKALMNKPKWHPDDCACPFCKAKRGELIGINHPRSLLYQPKVTPK